MLLALAATRPPNAQDDAKARPGTFLPQILHGKTAHGNWPWLPLGCGPVGARAYSTQMDTREAAQRWADVWERGWSEHDAGAITALYAEGAFWQQHPFREPEPGYLDRVFAEEESAQCGFGTPLVDGDQAAVHWSAQTRLTDGGTEDLAEVSLLRFRADGLVVEHRDFWSQE
jgi:hypothetical protein